MSGRLRLGIVGCGDVAHRHYLPAIASLAPIVSRSPPSRIRPRCRGRRRGRSRGVVARREDLRHVDEMLAVETLDAVFNLTPAPAPRRRQPRVLEAGVASTARSRSRRRSPRPTRSIDLAASPRPCSSSCAPGSAATRRGCAGSGPHRSGISAGRRSPSPTTPTRPGRLARVHRRPDAVLPRGVGPVFDHGVYRLHEMTTCSARSRQVQAMGSIALPTRRSAAAR